MICGIDNFSPFCYEFEASITVLELHEHKPLITQGYKAIIHMHTVMEEIEVHQIVSAYDKEKNKQMKSSFLKSGMRGVCRLLV